VLKFGGNTSGEVAREKECCLDTITSWISERAALFFSSRSISIFKVKSYRIYDNIMQRSKYRQINNWLNWYSLYYIANINLTNICIFIYIYIYMCVCVCINGLLDRYNARCTLSISSSIEWQVATTAVDFRSATNFRSPCEDVRPPMKRQSVTSSASYSQLSQMSDNQSDGTMSSLLYITTLIAAYEMNYG